MNTKIGTSFGLAMLMAMGIIATMLAFGFFSPSKASADVDIEDITLSSRAAGATGQIQIAFTTDNVVVAGSGQLIVTFDKTWGVPSSIVKEYITITTSGTTGGTSNPTIDPTIVIGANSTVVTITVGDTNPSRTDTQSLNASVSGTSATSDHILAFSPLAGISNPTSQATHLTSWITLTTTADTTPLDGGGAVPTTGSLSAATYDTDGHASSAISARAVSLSPTSGVNATSITATGKGYVTGSLTAFLDADSDDAFTAGETILGTSAAAVSAGTATVTFTASEPTFAIGENEINIIDGNGNPDASSAIFTMIGVVTTSAEAKRGASITVKLRQYAAGDVTSITIGGAGATLPSAVTVAAGTLNLVITVPTTTSLGTQRVNVVGAETRYTSIEIIGAPLTLSPATAVIAQKITVSGSGYTGSSNVSLAAGASCDCSFSIAGTAIASSKINSDATVTTDNSGNMVATVTIPSTTQTQTAGSYTFQVVDATGRTGTATLTIPSRTLTLDTADSRRGSTVTVTGSGFPASSSVSFTYGSTTVGSVTPDSVGAFTNTFTVPTTAGIPSTNTVTGTSSTDSLAGTATHKVPGATITVAEASAVSGNTITVTGAGFPGYATLTALSVGGVSAIPTPAPATDGDGDITAVALVPQLTTGTQAVLITVGGITANTSITVATAPAVVVVTTTDTADVFADDLASENLISVFQFNNATKVWSFYNPDFVDADANTYNSTSTGDIVWIRLVADVTFQGDALTEGWNLVALD